MLRDEKVAKLFTGMDYDLLVKQNSQDFFYMGNIMRNPLVAKEIDLTAALESYRHVLKSLIQDLNAPNFDKLNKKIKAGDKLSKEHLKAYHALKL